MTSSLQDSYSKVALFTVAFQSPALLWMVLDAELAGEAADTEIYHIVVVETWNFGGKEDILVGVGVLSDSHNRYKLLKRANTQLEKVELVFEDSQGV